MKYTIVENKRRHSLKRKKLRVAKSKPKSVSKLTKELDTVFSRFIRDFAAKDGICTCYTCGHKAPIAKMHAGHYVSRFYKETRWNMLNVKPQCPMCNLWRRGDPVTFRSNLVRDYGDIAVHFLEESRKISAKLSPLWLQQQIEFYKNKLSSLNS